jgi:hypothetical protein
VGFRPGRSSQSTKGLRGGIKGVGFRGSWGSNPNHILYHTATALSPLLSSAGDRSGGWCMDLFLPSPEVDLLHLLRLLPLGSPRTASNYSAPLLSRPWYPSCTPFLRPPLVWPLRSKSWARDHGCAMRPNGPDA